MLDRKANDLPLERADGTHVTALVEETGDTIAREEVTVTAGTWRTRTFVMYLFLIGNTGPWPRKGLCRARAVRCNNGIRKVMRRILRHEFTAFGMDNGPLRSVFRKVGVFVFDDPRDFCHHITSQLEWPRMAARREKSPAGTLCCHS